MAVRGSTFAETPVVLGGSSRCVYVFPLKLMEAVFTDVHGENEVLEKLQLVHSKVVHKEFTGFKVEMRMDCPSTLVPSGHVNVAVSGDVQYGDLEAQVSSIMLMLGRLRDVYDVCPADYSFIAMSDKRSLYLKMKDHLVSAHNEYVVLSGYVKDCGTEVQQLCRLVSSWVGDNRAVVGMDVIAAVAAFQAKLLRQVEYLECEGSHADRVANMHLLRVWVGHGVPEAEKLVPKDMKFSWEVSHHTLHCVYKQAVKKLGAVIGPIELEDMDNGEWRAVASIAGYPHRFRGDVASSQKGAMSKFFYSVIKYVDTELGYSILDLFSGAREYQDAYIQRFDEHVKNLMDCGNKFSSLFTQMNSVFDSAVVELADRVETTEYTAPLAQAVHNVGIMFGGAKYEVKKKWSSMVAKKVDRAALEFALSHQG